MQEKLEKVHFCIRVLPDLEYLFVFFEMEECRLVDLCN